MAIQHRRGNFADFDPFKMLPGEIAFPLDRGTGYYCVSPGTVKEVATREDIIEILDMSEQAYTALQQLISELEDETVLTGILADVSSLLDDVAINKSKINANTQDISDIHDALTSHMAEDVTQPSGAHGFKVESGTWIPTLRTATSTGQYSYSAREGVYVRQGNKVLVQFNLGISDVGSPADETLYISGLPYIPNPNGQSEAVSANLLDATGLGLESQYWLVSGRCMASGIVLYKMAPNAVAPAGMRPANVKVGSVFRGSIEYKI